MSYTMGHLEHSQKRVTFPYQTVKVKLGFHFCSLGRRGGLYLTPQKSLHPWAHVDGPERTREEILQIVAKGLQHDGWCILADTEETEDGNRAPSSPEALDESWQILGCRG